MAASGRANASYDFADYGQTGIPRDPCGDPPAPVGGSAKVPTFVALLGSQKGMTIATLIDSQTADQTPGPERFASSGFGSNVS